MHLRGYPGRDYQCADYRRRNGGVCAGAVKINIFCMEKIKRSSVHFKLNNYSGGFGEPKPPFFYVYIFIFMQLFRVSFNNRVSLFDEKILCISDFVMLIICQLLNLLNPFPH